MHSWRVLILPFMESGDLLYKRYNFNEPWDGPNNKKLLAERPPEYKCPSDPSTSAIDSTTTNYVAVVGSTAAWQRDKSTSLKDPDLQREKTTSILLIETDDSGIPWTEPRDICLDDLDAAHADSVPTVHTHHYSSGESYFCDEPRPGYVNVAMLDGSSQSLPMSRLKGNKLKRLLTVGGCTQENIDSPPDYEEPQINWPNCIALPVWIGSIVAMLYGAVRGRKRAKQRAAVGTP